MFDLTQPLNARIPRFPGDPEVRVTSINQSGLWRISSLMMGTHSGTHMDAPGHIIAEGEGIGAYRPDRLVGRGLVLDASQVGENAPIPVSVLEGVEGRTWPGWFAVVRTGWDQYWGESHYFQHPYISPELADGLVNAGAGIVAIDALSIDSTAAEGWEAHHILLGADVLVAENLCNLGSLQPARPYAFAFLPLSLGPADGSPARVVAWES